MARRQDGRHRAAIRRRNPMAPALREPLCRAPREADRKRYSRKAKHRRRAEAEAELRSE